jgi:hypothetical protein
MSASEALLPEPACCTEFQAASDPQQDSFENRAGFLLTGLLGKGLKRLPSPDSTPARGINELMLWKLEVETDGETRGKPFSIGWAPLEKMTTPTTSTNLSCSIQFA